MRMGFRRTGLRLGLLGLLVASVMVTTLLVGSAAAAGEVTCTGGSNDPLTGTINANVVVPAGASCRIAGTVNGNVTAYKGAAVGIRKDSIVSGNYTCNSCLFADLHGSTIGGNVSISKETDGSFIEGSTITGNLTIQSSDADGDSFAIGTGPMDALPNNIGGNLTFSKNTGPSSIMDNTIVGNLTCDRNAPAPASSGNTAESFQGQCAA
jgi:hypothetical protein